MCNKSEIIKKKTLLPVCQMPHFSSSWLIQRRLDGSNVRWNNCTLKIIVRLNLFKTMSRQHHSTELRHLYAANLVSCFYVKSVITHVLSFGAHVCRKLWTETHPEISLQTVLNRASFYEYSIRRDATINEEKKKK